MIVFYWWEEVDLGGTARRLYKLLLLRINTDTARRVPTMLTRNFE